MKRIVIFGAGSRALKVIGEIEKDSDTEIVAILDNYRIGDIRTEKGIYPIVNPEEIVGIKYDHICLATQMVNVATRQLMNYGVNRFSIDTQFVVNTAIGAREYFVSCFAKKCLHNNIEGNVAEAGVAQGEFAKTINEAFFDRKLYLFDTFEGFAKKDIDKEEKKAEHNMTDSPYYIDTSVDIVMRKMKYPQNVEIVKGYVPETLYGVKDRFIFVNLDMDLYEPTKAALDYFYSNMVLGGIILVHDFYNEESFPNLKNAVIEFCEQLGVDYFPIGDGFSVFIIKR